jgi:hypothetical protein
VVTSLALQGNRDAVPPRVGLPVRAIRYNLSNYLFLDEPSGIGYIGDVLLFWISRGRLEGLA